MGKRLIGVAGKDNFLAIRRPAQDNCIATQIGQAGGRTASGGHDVNFTFAIFPPDKSQPFAVERQSWMGDHAQISRQTPRYAASGRDGPQVILADADDVIFMDGRVAIVAVGFHGLGHLKKY